MKGRSDPAWLVNARVSGPELDVLFDGRGNKLIIWVLKHETHSQPKISKRFVVIRHGVASDEHGPRIRFQKAIEMA